MVLGAGAAPATEAVETNLEVVGRTDLGRGGPFDAVAVIGTTAVVAGDCSSPTVTVVDLEDPRRPRVVATLPMPPGTRAAELDATAVETPSFTGDLVAVGLAPCGGQTGPGVVLYDLSDPAAPELRGRTQACERCTSHAAPVSLASR